MEFNPTGPIVYWQLPFENLPDMFRNVITQSTVTLFAVTIALYIVARFINKNITKRPGRFQAIVEELVNMLYGLVEETMGKHNMKFAPYIGTLFLSSMFCSLIGMTQVFRSATADLSVTAAWALVTTGMVWYNNIKNFGFKAWLKSFTEPIALITPINVISEVATPLSMALRHFGNVTGGSIITSLIYSGLAVASNLAISFVMKLFTGLTADVVPNFPFLQVGLPAFLSIYFDLISSLLQALVFSLLTMVYVAAASPPPEEIPERPKKKRKSAN